MKICYKEKNFREESLTKIRQADTIIQEYKKQGLDMTLRQLYYQFVARDLIPNSDKSYSSLGTLISDARLAGLLDWEIIKDRTRELTTWRQYNDISHGLDNLADHFSLNHWEDQEYQVQVWVEKEALAGVIERTCSRWQVPFFSCRGYVSQSAMWEAGRSIYHQGNTAKTVIIHLGDHDPSGIDMSRDITDRLKLFGSGNDFEFKRIALNYDQIEEFNPPPNPAKVTDSRAKGYIKQFGYSSWELDALSPSSLDLLTETEIKKWIDINKYNRKIEEQDEIRDRLRDIASEEEERNNDF